MADPAEIRGWRNGLRQRLRWQRDPARFRTLAVMVPLHLAAFFALYYGASRLLEDAYGRAGMEGARQRLDHAVAEMPFFVPEGHSGRNPHLFVHAIAAHRDIALALYDPAGRPLGVGALPPGAVVPAVRAFLATDEPDRVWFEHFGGREVVQGLTRLVATSGCVPCHPSGTLLGAASMRLDYTAALGAVRGRLRVRVALLVLAWVALLGASAAIVRRTVQRSGARLRAELDAVEAGRSGTPSRGIMVLDPVSAEVHRSLRDFLARQRRHEAEVASRLAHVDQLAHLGELAAGLAHEIKNPLAGIQGALEVLRDEARGEEEKVRLYEEMLAELRRVNTILQRLLESGRPAPLRIVDTDLALLVRDTADLLAPGLRRKQVRLASELAPDLPLLRLDPAKMRQVLVNLIQNSAEAMRQGGAVTVRASRVPPAGGVVLEVADDGPGITAADRERIFQPFFTTKFTGTGLGLAISKSLVEQHGGRIEVDSEPGRGTRMFILLPCPAPDAAVAGEAAPGAAVQ